MKNMIYFYDMILWMKGIVIMLVIFLMACRQEKASQANVTDAPFQPTGGQADLVYNPVRPDGTIDSSFLPVLTWREEVFDFGTITEGTEIAHEFAFTNTGTAPLLILNASSTCGCTIPEWPKDQIAPGDSSRIRVVFNSTNKTGDQSKDVTIFANTFPNQTRVTIRGSVLQKKITG